MPACAPKIPESEIPDESCARLKQNTKTSKAANPFQALHGKVGELGPSFERGDKTFSQQVLTLLLKNINETVSFKTYLQVIF